MHPMKAHGGVSETNGMVRPAPPTNPQGTMSDIVKHRQPRLRSGPMKEQTSNEHIVKVVGIDLAQRSFHVYGLESAGNGSLARASTERA